MKKLSLLLLLALFTGTVLGQTDAPAPGTGAEEGAEGAEDKEECEEAWLYMEFLKTDIKYESDFYCFLSDLPLITLFPDSFD